MARRPDAAARFDVNIGPRGTGEIESGRYPSKEKTGSGQRPAPMGAESLLRTHGFAAAAATCSRTGAAWLASETPMNTSGAFVVGSKPQYA